LPLGDVPPEDVHQALVPPCIRADRRVPPRAALLNPSGARDRGSYPLVKVAVAKEDRSSRRMMPSFGLLRATVPCVPTGSGGLIHSLR
jgi:hypothetical protein